jgi:hypothetical protein
MMLVHCEGPAIAEGKRRVSSIDGRAVACAHSLVALTGQCLAHKGCVSRGSGYFAALFQWIAFAIGGLHCQFLWVL